MISGIRKNLVLWNCSQMRRESNNNKIGQILRKWTPKIRVQEKHLLKFWHLILYSDHCPYISVAKIRFFVCICVCIKFSQCDKLQMKTKLTIHYPPYIHALCNVTFGSYLPELESNTSPFESELAWWIPLPKWDGQKWHCTSLNLSIERPCEQLLCLWIPVTAVGASWIIWTGRRPKAFLN